MMISGIPSENIDLLKRIQNKSIIQVTRQIYKSDMNIDDFHQMADGPTEFTLDNGDVFNLFAITEINSIGIQEGKMKTCSDSYCEIDVTNNDFWKERLKKKICSILIFKSKYASVNNPSEFSIVLQLECGKEIYFEYLNEGDFPDTARITPEYLGPECIKRKI